MLRTMEEYDFGAIASLNQSKVLQLSKGEYIPKHENIALIGGIGSGIGTGKTHIAIALGLSACQQGYRVRFYTVSGLINELMEASESHRLSKLEAHLMRYQLII